MAQTAESGVTASDLIELSSEDRQSAMWRMPSPDLLRVIQDLMQNNQDIRATARLDALTILTLRSNG